MLRLGDIVLLDYPYTNQVGSKVRPGLVVGLNKQPFFNDVNVAYITTEIDSYIFDNSAVKITTHDLAEGSLKYESVVRVDKVITVQSKICRKVASLNKAKLDDILRKLVAFNVENFASHKYTPSDFIAGKTHIPVSGKVLGERELQLLVEASLDGWLTTGRFNKIFEEKLAKFISVKHVLTTNSGSSANLLAIATLTSPKLGEKALKQGDEVITVAAGFPTTVNPILQYGLVPVFIDVDIETLNIDVSQLELAISNKTRAIMLAHTLGNPFNLDAVMHIVRKYDLWLIEDCCDALGTTYTPTTSISDYKGNPIPTNIPRHVGTFGDIATLSFYPAHHITMGEGGVVFTNHGKLKPIIESFRDWGRDCFCAPGVDNTCNKRFCQQQGSLPLGYDHKYTYSHIGYNLKITDMQAAIGVAQLEKLEQFIVQRRENFNYLSNALADLSDKIILPKATLNSNPSWFGFPITLRENSGIERVNLLKYLDSKNIGSRLVFAGNLTRQPYFQNQPYRISGTLKNTDIVMNQSLWIGVCPMLTQEMLEFIVDEIKLFVEGKA